MVFVEIIGVDGPYRTTAASFCDLSFKGGQRGTVETFTAMTMHSTIHLHDVRGDFSIRCVVASAEWLTLAVDDPGGRDTLLRLEIRTAGGELFCQRLVRPEVTTIRVRRPPAGRYALTLRPLRAASARCSTLTWRDWDAMTGRSSVRDVETALTREDELHAVLSVA